MDAFDYGGFWWNPRQPNERWPGTLHFDQTDGATLSVIIPGESQKSELFHQLRSYEIILGLTTESKAVTLFQCFDRSATDSKCGFPRQITIFANTVLVGFHCNDINPLISVVSVSFQCLAEWFGASPMEYDVKPPHVTVRYNSPPPVVLYHDDGLCISIRSALSMPTQHYATSLIENSRIEIRATQPRQLRKFREIIQACQAFLSVACLTYCGVQEISLLPPGPEGEQATVGILYGLPIYKRSQVPSAGSAGFLFQFSDIRDRCQAIFTSWLSYADRLKRVHSLYYSGIYGQALLETRMLALTQAAEGFHRRFYKGNYIDQEQFEKVVFEPLKSAIPDGIDSSFRQSLINRLRFANEYSLRRRIKDMVVDHERALAVIVNNPKKFVDLIVDHRNDFTHHPMDPEELQADADYSRHLLQYNYVLRILMELCFLKVMGFSTDEITSLAHRCITYQKIADSFFAEHNGVVTRI